jgi:hypothetical protein
MKEIFWNVFYITASLCLIVVAVIIVRFLIDFLRDFFNDLT